MKQICVKSKTLMCISIIAFLLGSICSFVYSDVLNLDNCEPPITAHWKAQVIAWGYLLGCIMPLLLFTYRAAKREKVRRIIVITVIMMFHIVAVLIGYLYLLISNPYGVIW